MLPSTSPASLPDAFGLERLARFYRWHARLYDWTRPLFLYGRAEAVVALDLRADATVLDVGCGTGWSLPLLAERSTRVIGVEPVAAMRRQAQRRVARERLQRWVTLDPRPYGSHGEYAGAIDGLLMSYSLSMIPCYESVLDRARLDLKPGGALAVIDFLDAPFEPFRRWLGRSGVALGSARLNALEVRFPANRVSVHHGWGWRYYSFQADASD
jgi:S-adenosylmethionine-diacylgycerolhomoserine-N-methlytransferase